MKKTFAILGVVAVLVMAIGGVALARPQLPFSCSVHSARIGSSLVAQLHNNSHNVHKVLITIESQTAGLINRRVEVFGPMQMNEIGWLEGWSFVRGETVRVHETGYRDLTVTIP